MPGSQAIATSGRRVSIDSLMHESRSRSVSYQTKRRIQNERQPGSAENQDREDLQSVHQRCVALVDYKGRNRILVGTRWLHYTGSEVESSSRRHPTLPHDGNWGGAGSLYEEGRNATDD